MHETARLDGRPPRRAASTHLDLSLTPKDEEAITVVVTSTQVPAGPLRGLAVRALSRRELAATLDALAGS